MPKGHKGVQRPAGPISATVFTGALLKFDLGLWTATPAKGPPNAKR